MDANNKFKSFIIRNRIIILIVLAAFLASMVYSFYFRIRPYVDAAAYDIIAWNLVQGNGYRENLSVDIQYDYAIARVGPLYEYFLAGIYKIFGHHYEWVWFFQAILHALSAFFIYSLCLVVFDYSEKKRYIGFLAAAIFGFYPDLLEISAMLMTETMYLFLLILMVYLFFRFFDQRKWFSGPVLGFVSGIAVLSRPPVLFLLPIIVFYFIQKKQFLIGGLFILGIFVAVIPWSARNYQIYGQPMPLGAAGSYNLWIGNHLGANGEQEQSSEALEFIATHPIKDLAGKSAAEFKNFIWHHPGEFTKLTLLRINKYFSIIRPMGFWFYQHGIGQLVFVLSSAVASILLFIFGLAGMFRAWRRKTPKIFYLFLFTLITPLIIFVSVVETRYRFQIYPFLAIFSAYMLTDSLATSHWRENKSLWISAIILLTNGLVDLSLNVWKIKDKIGVFFN